ncbi:MAG: GyrI-like domain-containing protein [Hyphomicrobiaceae bacterium]|nr:GyrI-like domain-containing protein [Hyphomicrobiaceae bacterium]
MSAGIVYLRPVPVARIRVFGPHGDAAREAWSRLFAWADRTRQRRRFERGFGLLFIAKGDGGSDRPGYDACIELPEDIELDSAAGFVAHSLPGGAYMRARHRGPVEMLGESLRELRTVEAQRRGLTVDPHRPLMEIYHTDAELSGKPHRIDLCVPVCF